MSKKAEWKADVCHLCMGNGRIFRYSEDNGFEAKTCPDCGGCGTIFASKKGILAKWPGGPFVGRYIFAWDEFPCDSAWPPKTGELFPIKT